MTAILAVIVVLACMVAELRRSLGNEATLRREGAVEPRDDVHRAMAWIYPLIFVAMGAEGFLRMRPSEVVVCAGLAIFLAAKALKYWAIATLGTRWTFRVLVPAGSTLISSGPYAYIRHPNYLAVLGEITGFALFAGARWTGIASFILFGALIRRRIRVEERALYLARS